MVKNIIEPVLANRRKFLAGTALVLATSLSGLQIAAAEDKAPVVLGFATGLSGAQAQYGRDNVKIGELFAEQMNSQGGIDGRQVSVVSGDTQDQPDIAISLGRRLIRESNATALFGHGGSGLTLALSQALKSTKVPLLLSYIWGNTNTGPSLPSVYRIGPFNAYVATLMAKYLEQSPYKNIVILAEDTAYGTDFAKDLTGKVGGGLKVETIPFQAKIQDLSPVLGKLASGTQPDAIIVAGNYQIIYSLQNQIPAAGLKSQIIGAWDYPTTPEFWETAGKNGVGTIYATFTGPSVKLTPTGEAFRASYSAKFGRDPLFYEYFLWDCLNALRQAVTDSKSVDPAVLTETLAKVSFEGTTGPIRFSQEEGAWNQALSGTLFMKQYTEVNQKDAAAKVVAEIAP